VTSRIPSNPFATFPTLLARLRELDAALAGPADPGHPECDVSCLFAITTSAGHKQYTARCFTCGRTTGKTSIAHRDLSASAKAAAVSPDVFKPRWGRYWDRYRARRDALRSELRRIRWETPGFYALCIASPEWAAKRQEVMARARQGSAFPVCESCGVSPATEVHHLSYRRLGNEPLDDLMAVCGPCHRDIEAAKEEHRAELSYEE
jgi:5-methylcytosine-specific restriction endonuclease McrA